MSSVFHWMDGGKYILQLQDVRLFLSDRYDTTEHPNYKYLSDYDHRNAFTMNGYGMICFHGQFIVLFSFMRFLWQSVRPLPHRFPVPRDLSVQAIHRFASASAGSVKKIEPERD